jgi:hypothetical protein
MNHRTVFQLALLLLVALVTMAAGGFRDPAFVTGMTKPVVSSANAVWSSCVAYWSMD